MNRSFIPLILACGLIIAAFAAGCTTGQTGSSPEPARVTLTPTPVPGSMIEISAGGKSYPAYLAAPRSPGTHPGIVLVHSFNGLEQGYRDMCDRMAGDGFVVIAPEWQTFSRQAGDPEVEAVIRSSVSALQGRSDVDPARLGLTGFCAGGRYTMLFLPQLDDFRAGVAWYGFPFSRGFTNNTTPASHIPELQSPVLIIHGSRDQPSPVTDVFNYSRSLDAAGKYFELKVYQGQPHGFMIVNGSLSREDYAEDAYGEMTRFFSRKL